jgi:hypothetical protein
MSAYNQDSQLRGSYGFNGNLPGVYGDGLAVLLSRATGDHYVKRSWREIQKAK